MSETKVELSAVGFAGEGERIISFPISQANKLVKRGTWVLPKKSLFKLVGGEIVKKPKNAKGNNGGANKENSETK